MKNVRIITLIAFLGMTGLISPVHAQMATTDEAMTVAANWITLIIHQKGDWGGSQTAEVQELQKFKRGDRELGYFCRVKPTGFIVVGQRQHRHTGIMGTSDQVRWT